MFMTLSLTAISFTFKILCIFNVQTGFERVFFCGSILFLLFYVYKYIIVIFSILYFEAERRQKTFFLALSHSTGFLFFLLCPFGSF